MRIINVGEIEIAFSPNVCRSLVKSLVFLFRMPLTIVAVITCYYLVLF